MVTSKASRLRAISRMSSKPRTLTLQRSKVTLKTNLKTKTSRTVVTTTILKTNSKSSISTSRNLRRGLAITGKYILFMVEFEIGDREKR